MAFQKYPRLRLFFTLRIGFIFVNDDEANFDDNLYRLTNYATQHIAGPN